MLKLASLVKIVSEKLSKDSKGQISSIVIEFEVLQKVSIINIEKDQEGIHFIDAIVKPVKEFVSWSFRYWSYC